MDKATLLDPQVLDSLRKNNIEFRVVECDEGFADTYAFCERYGFSLSQSANTIIVAGKTEQIKYCACVALATTKLDVNKKVCQLLGVKKASFATQEQTMKETGMKIGGVTVFGIENMPVFVDSKVMDNRQIVMGGGNRVSKVLLDPKELVKLPNVQIVEELAIVK